MEETATCRWTRPSSADTSACYGCPATGDKFLLRKLLLRVQRRTPVADLPTHANLTDPNANAACFARNLFSDEEARESAMAEALQVQMLTPYSRPFAILLMPCDAPDAADLCEHQFIDLTKDLTHWLNACLVDGINWPATSADERRYFLLEIDQRLPGAGHISFDYKSDVPLAAMGLNQKSILISADALSAGTGRTIERSRATSTTNKAVRQSVCFFKFLAE